MQFRDLRKQYEALKTEIDAAIEKVLLQCNFISGEQVTELEEALAAYVGCRHCVTCGNGTDALTMAFMAWGIGRGDAVFVPDFTFFASGEAAAVLGAEPVFVDVDPHTFNLSPESLRKAIEGVRKEGRLVPKAIVAVDLFGLPADYTAIKKIALDYHLHLLEDAAQGFGGELSGKMACSFGEISITSFFPAKPLGCYGDGGAIFTDCGDTAAYLRSIRVHGKGNSKYDNIRLGLNSRLDTLQAAILLPKLRAFIDYEKKAVNEIAGQYNSLLKDIVQIPDIPEGYVSSWAQYSVLLPCESARDGLQTYLKKKNIPSMIYYPKPMHMQEAFCGIDRKVNDFPVTDSLCKTILSLPMHPYLSKEEVTLISHTVEEYINQFL